MFRGERGRAAALSFPAVLALAVGCATVRPADEEQLPVVTRLEITGNEALSDQEIASRIRTAATSWVPLSEEQRLDEAILETDLKRIVRLYQARGYYKARVVERRVVSPRPGEVQVNIRIDEGPPTRVADFFVEGLDHLPPELQASLQANLPLQEGAVFLEGAYDEARNLLLERLRESGFAEAEVNGVVHVELPTDEASVVLGADTGVRYSFGDIFVAGAQRIPRARIVAEAREIIQPGTLYSETALNDVQERLSDLGVFAAVKVTRGAPDREAQTVPVVISVREAPFRSLRAGVGVGVDPNRTELPRLTGEWANRNFFGGLRRLTFRNEYALVFLPNIFAASWNDPSRRGVAGTSALEFDQPDFFSRDLTFTSSIQYERWLQQSFRYNAGIARVGLVWRVSRWVTIVPSYNLNVFQLTGTIALAEGRRRQDALLDPCAATGELCVLSYLEQRVTWERRDNPVNPTRGYLLTLTLQEGSRFLLGDYDYLRVLPEGRLYVPVGQHVFALRLRTGLLFTAADQSSSVLTRFFLGGSNSHRGFGNRDLSPKLVVQSPYRPWADAYPVGGNGMVEGNAELRLTLPRDLGLVLFVDAGEVTPQVAGLGFGQLHVASGFGLRYYTVVGAVRLDFAWRLNQFLFPPPVQPGSYAVPNLHFSIGEAF
ncbi:MAG: autotransporter assembly complex protein TamA [Myxococcales bacterium]